jgi:hypothetical protein
MKKGTLVVWWLLSILILTFRPVYAAEPEQKPPEPAEKPLGPGWLSLDGTVGVMDSKIADGKTALQNALFGINISGFLDTSWTFSTNHPGSRFDRDISGRYFDQDHNDVVFNAFNITLDKPEKDWGVGFHLGADFGRAGELLREATFYGVNKFKGAGNGGEPSIELREAFMTTTVPLGEGIGVKGGLFVTPLGTEILPNPGAYNDNISRSFLFNFGIPLRHLGVLFSYPLLKILTVSAGPVTGWDDPHDNNNAPSALWGVSFTPVDMFSLASNFIYGPEQRGHVGRKRFTMSHVATIKPFDPLSLSVEYTYGHEDKVTSSLRDTSWQGLATIASYGWTDRFTTALRAEFFKDADGARTIGSGLFGTSTPRDVDLGELTLTGAYKFTKMLVGRAEVRQDWASKNVFAVGNSGRADKSQTTLAMQVIYTY